MAYELKDIKPATPLTSLRREEFTDNPSHFPIPIVSIATGMSPTFIRKALGHSGKEISALELLALLDMDAFSETFIPRSKVLAFLSSRQDGLVVDELILEEETLIPGCAVELLSRLPQQSIQCVATSTPYWAMRLYEKMRPVHWADGEICSFGLEQTPEGFVRHSVEVLARLMPAITDNGSVWWNIMDTYNTRTQIRGNASEALKAMQGKDSRGWGDHDCRRYSAGHSYLKDGEQCMIPFLIAERASRIGYYVKSVISWSKTSSMPEPQNSRVSRNIEYVIHLTKNRTPYFDKEAYRNSPAKLGGRNGSLEPDRLSDSWFLPTSSGRDGHGAQFPIALPGRCISISTKPGDVVLDPFLGAGSTAIAARLLGRRFIGFDINEDYLLIAKKRLAGLTLADCQS